MDFGFWDCFPIGFSRRSTECFRNALEETKEFLELLDLSGNCLSSVPALNGSQRLTYLDLSSNAISSLPASQFRNLPMLKEVRLGHNQIVNLGPIAFMDVPSLEQLSLKNNSIRSLGRNRFHAFKGLQILDLSFNKITAVIFLLEVCLTCTAFKHRCEIVSMPEILLLCVIP